LVLLQTLVLESGKCPLAPRSYYLVSWLLAMSSPNLTVRFVRLLLDFLLLPAEETIRRCVAVQSETISSGSGVSDSSLDGPGLLPEQDRSISTENLPAISLEWFTNLLSSPPKKKDVAQHRVMKAMLTQNIITQRRIKSVLSGMRNRIFGATLKYNIEQRRGELPLKKDSLKSFLSFFITTGVCENAAAVLSTIEGGDSEKLDDNVEERLPLDINWDESLINLKKAENSLISSDGNGVQIVDRSWAVWTSPGTLWDADTDCVVDKLPVAGFKNTRIEDIECVQTRKNGNEERGAKRRKGCR